MQLTAKWPRLNQAAGPICLGTKRTCSPTFWNLAEVGILKRIRKENSSFSIDSIRQTISCLGANRIKIHEPRLKNRPSKVFERLIHLLVQINLGFDLVQ